VYYSQTLLQVRRSDLTGFYGIMTAFGNNFSLVLTTMNMQEATAGGRSPKAENQKAEYESVQSDVYKRNSDS